MPDLKAQNYVEYTQFFRSTYFNIFLQDISDYTADVLCIYARFKDAKLRKIHVMREKQMTYRFLRCKIYVMTFT